MPGSGGHSGIAAVCLAAVVTFAGALIASPAAGGASGTPGASAAQDPPPEYEIPEGPLYMEPFPVVRIRGELARGGARVRLLRVTAGRRAVVRIRCKGRGCPVRRLRRKPGRIGKFERFLPTGTRVTIRVTRPERIGKYVRLRIRAGRPPARTDACVVPGTPDPTPCPPR
jgi:hypothetical protein